MERVIYTGKTLSLQAVWTNIGVPYMFTYSVGMGEAVKFGLATQGNPLSIGCILAVAAFGGYLLFTFINPRSISYRVSYNPYEGVDWGGGLSCLTQFHDHVTGPRLFEQFLGQYDAAGYQAVSVLHYSGVPSHPDSWRKRYWPVSSFIASVSNDAELLSRFKNLRILVPGAEEVGYHHILSPFMTDYIEKWEGNDISQKQPFHYESSQTCIDRIRERGGLAILAHPWNRLEHYDSYSSFQAIEVYSGYANHKAAIGELEDTNSQLLRVWDHLLVTKSTRIWGIGSNDWFGPGREDLREVFPTHIDTGKTVILIEDWTLESLRKSFEKGALFAVKDSGMVKGDFPTINKIQVDENHIQIDTSSEVTWCANQISYATGVALSLSDLPSGLKYIRAQVKNATGEVFIQPFTLEPADAN